MYVGLYHASSSLILMPSPSSSSDAPAVKLEKVAPDYRNSLGHCWLLIDRRSMLSLSYAHCASTDTYGRIAMRAGYLSGRLEDGDAGAGAAFRTLDREFGPRSGTVIRQKMLLLSHSILVTEYCGRLDDEASSYSLLMHDFLC